MNSQIPLFAQPLRLQGRCALCAVALEKKSPQALNERQMQPPQERLMKSFVAIAALLVTAAAPHADAAMRPSATPAWGPALRLAADSDAAGDRDSVRRQAMDEMREWQRKLHDAGTTAAVKGKAA